MRMNIYHLDSWKLSHATRSSRMPRETC